MTESRIIEMIAEALDCKSSKYGLGNFGDDAYVVPAIQSGEVLVQSTDSFVEGTHFTKEMGFCSVGWKSLVSSLSDIYAMGAFPSFYSLNLIVPKDFKEDCLKEFLKGLAEASKTHNVKLLGGDVTRGENFNIVVQASGFQRKDLIKTNKGSKKGDVLITNAGIGHALLGLEQFKAGNEKTIKDSKFVEAFLFPKINQDLGPWLSKFNSVTSLTDISDGLHRELENLCRMNDSSVMVESVPLSSLFIEACKTLNLDPEVTALQGGEEYGLLWTVEPDFLQEFLTKYHMKFKTKPFVLGRVGDKKSKRRIVYENQSLIESIKPFEHFTS